MSVVSAIEPSEELSIESLIFSLKMFFKSTYSISSCIFYSAKTTYLVGNILRVPHRMCLLLYQLEHTDYTLSIELSSQEMERRKQIKGTDVVDLFTNVKMQNESNKRNKEICSFIHRKIVFSLTCFLQFVFV